MTDTHEQQIISLTDEQKAEIRKALWQEEQLSNGQKWAVLKLTGAIAGGALALIIASFVYLAPLLIENKLSGAVKANVERYTEENKDKQIEIIERIS